MASRSHRCPRPHAPPPLTHTHTHLCFRSSGVKKKRNSPTLPHDSARAPTFSVLIPSPTPPLSYAHDINLSSLDVLNHQRLLNSARADPSAVSFQVHREEREMREGWVEGPKHGWQGTPEKDAPTWSSHY